MLPGMLQREFLGWDEPFLNKVVGWLLLRRDELPYLLVVVPTAQSGRRLREALAAATGALLAPRVVTPGSFLQVHAATAAPDWMERLAWMETLEAVSDWSAYTALFPESPGTGRNWAGGLAQDLVQLRHTLQENGLLLATAARKLADSVEAERWAALADLESQVERTLEAWGAPSRSRLLAASLPLPPDISGIVLAGVPEMPPLVERAWAASSLTVTALIGAPSSAATDFSPSGRPSPIWNERTLAQANGETLVAADPRQQAVEALRVIANRQTSSDEVALGAADPAVGSELARALTREGWITFHPAEAQPTRGLARFLKIWCAFLVDPSLAVTSDLLTFPECGVLIGGKRAHKARQLAELRDRWMIVRADDLQRRLDTGKFRNDSEKETAATVLEMVNSLERWRSSHLNESFLGSLERFLKVLARTSPATEEVAAELLASLAKAAPLIQQVRRSAGFWLELILAELPSPLPTPPEDRVIDVQGWLELFHEPGKHLVLCGMNDGKIPARSGGEPWLSEASREKLGLIKDTDRSARDAYLYHAMIQARLTDGQVDVICGKSGATGDALLPSRLLLAVPRAELPARVKALFREVEPPEAGLRWEADWRWQPRVVSPPLRLNATSLGDYLSCPFRYYLKHVLAMQRPEPDRSEWRPRDFGTVAHEILERWGRDLTARTATQPELIHAWLSAELDRVVSEWFGKNAPLAVRIQTEALRQRLVWFSRTQAELSAEGWEIVDVERKVEVPVGEAKIIAKIDRIDQHRETGRRRVLDYKTGKVNKVDGAHRKKVNDKTQLAAHLSFDGPAVYVGEEKGKSAQFLWINLQLPLYAVALADADEALPAPCYFTLGATEADVAIHEWTDFETADMEAARACAAWVAGQIAETRFWPPAEKVAYDDYQALAAGRSLAEMVAWPIS
jgi:ATP-dependent helicase/nuclease subunit B